MLILFWKDLLQSWVKTFTVVAIFLFNYQICVNTAMANTEKELPEIIFIENQENPEKSVLKNIASKVEFPLSDEDKQLISDMKQVLYNIGGVGLAAPQVGVGKKIALVYINEEAASLRDNASVFDMHVIINPEYEPAGDAQEKDKIRDFEGCLSIESVAGKVLRFDSIRLKYQDEGGNAIDKIVSGFYARVLQHEIDHLNGILITDRLTDSCPQGDRLSMLKLRRAELRPEQRAIWEEYSRKKGIELDD